MHRYRDLMKVVEAGDAMFPEGRVLLWEVTMSRLRKLNSAISALKTSSVDVDEVAKVIAGTDECGCIGTTMEDGCCGRSARAVIAYLEGRCLIS